MGPDATFERLLETTRVGTPLAEFSLYRKRLGAADGSSAVIVMAEVPCRSSYGGIMCQVSDQWQLASSPDQMWKEAMDLSYCWAAFQFKVSGSSEAWLDSVGASLHQLLAVNERLVVTSCQFIVVVSPEPGDHLLCTGSGAILPPARLMSRVVSISPCLRKPPAWRAGDMQSLVDDGLLPLRVSTALHEGRSSSCGGLSDDLREQFAIVAADEESCGLRLFLGCPSTTGAVAVFPMSAVCDSSSAATIAELFPEIVEEPRQG